MCQFHDGFLKALRASARDYVDREAHPDMPCGPDHDHGITADKVLAAVMFGVTDVLTIPTAQRKIDKEGS